MTYIKKNIIEICTAQEYDLPKRVCLAISFLIDKGYGDKEQELGFVTDVFKKLFRHYPILEHFEWSQYQDYNDNYNAYDLESYYVNNRYFLNVFGFNWWDDNDGWLYNFSIDDNEAKQIDKINTESNMDEYYYLWEKEHAKLQTDLAPVKIATDSILVFLKALYDYYKPYYFIYLFGRRATVTITKKGVDINNQQVKYVDGSDCDKSFKPNSSIYCY